MLGALGPARRRGGAARGFTVIELMVVVALVAVILALAAPSMYDYLVRQRVAGVAAELMTDLQFARTEAVTRNRNVWVTFRTDDAAGRPPMTCYTIHTLGAVGECDCRKPIGSACDAVAEIQEIKTVQLLRSTHVELQPPDWPANQLLFSAARGLAGWQGHFATDPGYTSDWHDYEVDIASARSGVLRARVNLTGRPQLCSPNGSISGVPACGD